MAKVMFRKFKNGDVIALFPQLAGDSNPYTTCLSYMHIGQHGAASVDLWRTTKPATETEYKPLLAELISIGYENLMLCRRFSKSDLLIRKSHANKKG